MMHVVTQQATYYLRVPAQEPSKNAIRSRRYGEVAGAMVLI